MFLMADQTYSLRCASGPADVQAAQRLRYDVFVRELGADGALVDHDAGREEDAFDAHAEHLLLCDAAGDVVGTYRFMCREAAAKAGRFYAESEFDISRLKASPHALLELGRSCVRADHRGGMALLHLWQGIARIVADRKIDILFGTASFHGSDPRPHAQALSYLHHHHLTPAPLRPIARQAQHPHLPLEELDRRAAMLATPSLIKSYLRLGGTIGDGVFADRQFNTTDVLLVMNINEMNEKQRNAYLQGGAR